METSGNRDTIHIDTDYVTREEVQVLVDTMKALQQGMDTLLSKKHKKSHKKSRNKKTKKEYISESNSESTESNKDSSDKSDEDNSDTESQKSISKMDEYILQNLYNSISKYNRERDIQKLFEYNKVRY